ncbi:MAG: glutaredoxin-related protein [Bacteroides sp.]|nr:glutaredoxin-related protein [Bacteroides sp.]MCM1447347.1 glutaredoxin-related protein [Bacteroides sp.]MCM1515835.1 glutaredoxin-related protein [Paraprevotella sp.]
MIKIFVMQTCPDCTAVKAQANGDARFQMIDIGEHVRNLKHFLSIRDTHPAFDTIRGKGAIGIPCFVMEDGSVYFSAEEAGISFGETTAASMEENIPDGATCSIDGTGC